ncbi:MAG: FecR domain-containing protein, partial [Desulfobacterales bacterium]|nr:FecR domain-containing protein [Desulfobacterales bacterium]
LEFRGVDESEILLRSGTEIKINRCGMENEDTFLRSIYLKAGRILTRLRRVTGKESRYSIETPAAVAAARGTRFRIRVDQEATFTEVLEGSVRVGAMEAYVDLNENEGSRVKTGVAPEPPRKLLDSPRPLDLQERYTELPIHIRFTKIDGAASYRTVVARDREMKDVVLESVISPDAPLTIPRLPDGQYHLYAGGVDDIGLESAPSEPASFRVMNMSGLLVPERSYRIITGK